MRRALIIFAALFIAVCGNLAYSRHVSNVRKQTAIREAWVASNIASLRPRKSEISWEDSGFVGSVAEGMERARREKRPLFLLMVTGDLRSGRC